MHVEILGGGPAGLTLAILLKRHDPAHRVRVVERGPRGATWGFGVVFSDRALDFLRADAPDLHDLLAPRILDLNAAAKDMEGLLRRLIWADVELTAVTTSGLWPVAVDPGGVEQVVINLVVNARDAMPHGGTLTIETANVELDDAYVRTHPDAAPGPTPCSRRRSPTAGCRCGTAWTAWSTSRRG